MSDKSNRKILSLLFFGVLMGALDIAIIGPALPSIQASFHIGERSIPWIINIYVLANLVGTPLLGRFSDLYGRKWIYIISLLLFGTGSAVVMLSINFDQALIGRAIQGFGAGGIFPVAAAVIGDTFPKEKQGAALGMIGAVFGMAFIIGPVIGGILLMFSWHWIFAINLPIAVLLSFFAYKILPATRKTHQVYIDYQGMFLLTLILAAFAYGINSLELKETAAHILKWNHLPLILASLMLLPLFYRMQKKSPQPLISPALLQKRQLIYVFLLGIIAGVGEVGVMYIPTYAKTAFDISNSKASFMLMPLVITLLIGAPLGGRFTDKKGPKPVLLLGSVLVVTGYLLLSYTGNVISGFFASTMIVGFGLSILLGAPARYIINRETNNQNRAIGQSVLTVFTSSGLLTSAALAGALIAGLGGGMEGLSITFAAFGLLSIFAILVSSLLKNY